MWGLVSVDSVDFVTGKWESPLPKPKSKPTIWREASDLHTFVGPFVRSMGVSFFGEPSFGWFLKGSKWEAKRK